MEKKALSFGLPAVNPLSITDVLTQSQAVSQANMVQAELAPPTSMNALNFAQKEAVARGYLRHFTSKLDPADPTTADVLKVIKGAIQSSDFATLQRVSPDLASVLSIYADNPAAIDKYHSFAKEILQGQIAIAESTNSIMKAEAAEASARTVAGISAGTPNIANVIYRDASSLTGIGGFVRDVSSEVNSIRLQASTESDEAVKTALLDRANAVEDSLLKGAVSNTLRNLTSKMTEQLRAALASGDTQYINSLPSSVRSNFFVLEQSFSSAEQRKKLDDLMAEYASGPAKFIEDEAARKAQAEANEFVDVHLPKLTMGGGLADIKAGADTLFSNVDSISGLSDGGRKELKERISVEAARGLMAFAVSRGLNEQQVLDMGSYVRGTRGSEGLPTAVIEALDSVKIYAATVDDKGFLDSVINTFSLQRQRELEQAAKETSIARATQFAATGQANPQTEEGRSAASNLILRDLNSIVTRNGSPPVSQLPTDLFTNPSYANDQRFSQIFTRTYNTQNLMPTELQSALQSVADGNLRVTSTFNYQTVLAHYDKMRLIEGPTGSIPNPALDALSLEQRGILNFLLEAPTVIGSPDQIASMFSSARQLQLKEEYPSAVKRFLGGVELDEWLTSSVDGYDLLNNSERASIQALSNFMIAQSMSTSGMNMSESSISRAINRQMNEWFPDGGGKVVQFDQFGMPSRRTKYALSKTVGADEDLFIEYVLNDVNRLAADGFTARSFYKGDSVLPAASVTGNLVTMPLRAAQSVANVFSSLDPYLELVAAGPDALGGVSYYLHEFDPRTGIRKMVQRKDGNVPLIFSTSEKGFSDKINAIKAKENYEELRRAAREKLIWEDEMDGAFIP